MKQLSVINTGGTFNKVYDPLTGTLKVAPDNRSVEAILRHYYGNIETKITAVIHKDSLTFTDADRDLLATAIINAATDNVIVVHGTDTMHQSAAWLDQKGCHGKKVIFVGAMVPYSIQKEEATANFSLAVGFLNAKVPDGIYIAMHGLVGPYRTILKDKAAGRFVRA
jgi:L-asparaginase